MLISKKKKFIFIHIPKNAGQSITSTLLKYCISDRSRNVVNFLGARNYIRINTKLKKYFNRTLYDHNFKDHERACAIKNSIGDEYEDYFKFAIVRNPWDWLFSKYKYALKNTRHFRHKFVKNNFSSFDEFVQWECLKNDNKKSQTEFLLDKAGHNIVDFIGRFENLEDDFRKICHRIEVDEKIPHFNKSLERNYREYYSEKSRDLVREYYASDIDLFDYEF
jgi:hypothetical protein